MLRVAFVPKDAYELLRKDQGTFEYLYMQVRKCFTLSSACGMA